MTNKEQLEATIRHIKHSMYVAEETRSIAHVDNYYLNIAVQCMEEELGRMKIIEV